MRQLLEQTSSTNHDNIVTVDESWFFLHNEQPSQWLPIGSPRPVAPCRTIASKKILVTIVWGINGVYVLDFLPESMTMTADYFQENVISKAKDKIEEISQRPLANTFYFHCDNARVHTAKATTTHLGKCGFTKMMHPPYSPDLAPSDFFLFGTLKHELKGWIFQNKEQLETGIQRALHKIGPDVWKNVFSHWIHRLRVVESGLGDYFE